jgi:hypothetical protein
LIVGEALIGRLQVTNGGRTLAVTTTVGTRDHGATTDGFLSVEGVNATQPALLTAGDRGSGGLFVATGAGTDALITVSAGGAMSLTQLSLADGAQSNALMFVDGMEAAEDGERRSTVIAPLPPAPEGIFSVPHRIRRRGSALSGAPVVARSTFPTARRCAAGRSRWALARAAAAS